jgi:lactate permease
MQALLAAAPLAVILIGMVVLRRSAAVAGGFGLALALGLAVTVFDLPGGGVAGGLRAAAGVLAEAAHSTATILWIILPALAIFEFQRRAGAIGRIRDALAALTGNRRLQTLLIAWFFGLFMEGAAGFGTPVALAAPLLAGLGHPPVRAVALALLGHAAGVSFGAVGTPVLAQAGIAGLDAGAIAGPTALLHAAASPVLLLLMVRLADAGPLSRADLAWTGIAALCFFLPSLALAWFVGPELPTLGGALVGLAAFVALLRRNDRGGGPDPKGLLPDLAPYLVILALVLATRLIAPLREVLTGFAPGWHLEGGFAGSFQPFYHPGSLLFLGFLAGAVITGRQGLIGAALGAAIARLLPVALALLVMLTLSRLMVHAGMIDALAAAASGTGPAWPLIAPLIGVLGTFITGSATASNVLFTELQVSTAARLGLPATALAAAQGFGAAVGNIVAPHNIIAGSATVGLTGREGEVLRLTAWGCLVCAGLGGAVAFAALVAG